MSARRARADVQDTRSAIIDRAVQVASFEGLEGLTIGRLAAVVGMSKSGLIGHFGSKEGLQVAALRMAADCFRQQVWDTASESEAGLPRLRAVRDLWIDYLRVRAFTGGCILVAASFEFDGRAGPVRDLVVETLDRWREALQVEARVAVVTGQLPPETDPDQLAFEMHALGIGANQLIQLNGDLKVLDRAHRAMCRLLEG